MNNIYANFDILYLMLNIKIKYSELNIYEINVMLYLAQLLSLYDGNLSSKWGYAFTSNEYGGPLSAEIALELKDLCDNNKILHDDEKYYSIIEDNKLVNNINALSNQFMFKWRTKYTQCAIDSIMLKTLPQITNAIQNEPGIAHLKSLNRHSTLHDDSDKSVDSLFDDFKLLKNVVGDARKQILVPASIWIEYLSAGNGGLCYDR